MKGLQARLRAVYGMQEPGCTSYCIDPRTTTVSTTNRITQELYDRSMHRRTQVSIYLEAVYRYHNDAHHVTKSPFLAFSSGLMPNTVFDSLKVVLVAVDSSW